MIPLLCLVRAVSHKEVYDGDAGEPQLSRLVSTVFAWEQGGGHIMRMCHF